VAKDPKTIGYAKALFEIARSEGDLERVADEFFRLARVLEKEHELRQTLTDIAVPTEAKEKLVDDLLGEKALAHTVNILKFVVGQGRARELVEIADELARIAEEESKREIAEVRVAVPLTEDQTERLAEALGRATGKRVTVKTVVDPSVIGGVLARVGDSVIDGSVKHHLEVLRERLKL
jgi:F-type H+-transporting ATPase subunit delta